MRTSSLTITFAVLAIMTSVLQMQAQSTKGSLTGIAEDSASAMLLGAKVELQPSGASAVSNGQGEFTIPNLEPGKYAVTVSYVGFVAYSADVTVVAGTPTKVDAVLKVATANEEVTVYAERLQGEVEAINIERTAENIVQVLPSKVINSLPNTNIADAVGRVPSVTLERDEGEGKYVSIRGTEPRLSNVTIDGVNVPSPEGGVRNIKLDVVPAGLVDRIEVNKTLSANQDGDAIGGSVNLVTRIPTNKPTYQFGVEGGYTPIQDGRRLTGFNGTVGQRFGTQKKFGILLGGTYDKNNRGIDDLEPGQNYAADPSGKNIAVINNEDLRYYKYDRTRYGFDTAIDYNFKQGSSIFLRGLYSDFHDYGDTRVYTANFGSTIDTVNGSQITFKEPGSFQYRHYIRRPDQQVFSVLTGVRHEINSWLLTTDFAVSRGHNIGGQDFPTTRFTSSKTPNLGLDLSNPLIPKFQVLDGSNVFDTTTYSLQSTTLPKYHSTQLNFQGAAALAKTYSVKNHFATFEIGAKVRDAHKTQNQDDHVYSPVLGATPFTLDQVLASQTDPTFYDRALPFGPSTDYRKIRQLIQPSLGTSLKSDTAADGIASALATWDLRERIYAGYAMNTIGLGKLRLQTGVRIEATDASYGANKFNPNNTPPISPVSNSGGYIDVLPSVQVQYALPHDTNLRATYGIGISRPNFQDQVPTEQFDPNATPQTRQKGNPDLKPTRAQNFDVLIEHYFRPLGILQAGFFYKALSNPIYPTGQIVDKILVLQSVNGPSAHIAGIEMSWEQRLSFLPGLLKGLGVSANYSYTTSKVDFPAGFSGGRVDHPSLQRQAPNTWNLGATYDKARLSMRFGVSHNDANIYAYQYVAGVGVDQDPITGIKGPRGDQYLYAHTQYDVQGSYRLFKGLSATVSGLNLSNEVFGFYTGSPKYPNQREFYKPTVTFGLRWNSASE